MGHRESYPRPPAPRDAAAVTRYAELTRAQAVAVVAAFLLLMGWLVAGERAAAPVPAAVAEARARQGGDVELYRAIVARVRAGEGYYDAAGAELRGRAYPVRPVFNWRQPTYAWLLARLPSPLVGSALLVLIGLAVVVLTRRWMGGAGVRATLAASLMVVSLAGAFVPSFVFLQESWAGFLVALSVCLFARERWRPAVAAALAALAFRELALLPCAVGLALALARRRWPEVTAWVVGLAAYAALLAWHLAVVTSHTAPGDVERGWLALGGATFVVETFKWSPLFAALPSAAVAVAMPFVLLGLGGWRDPAASRVALIVAGYLAAFAVVGNPFNDYWGAVYAPLLPFGLMAAPRSVRDLARALRPA